MQYAVVVPPKVRTAQYANLSEVIDNLSLSLEREGELMNALGRRFTWGDASATLVEWTEVLDCYLEAVEWDGKRLYRTRKEVDSALETAGLKFKRILPNTEFGPLFINLEG